MKLTTAVLALIFAAMPFSAWAYLDPGTGSMILQGILAAVAVTWATLKLYWERITLFFSDSKNQESTDDSEAREGE